jgi:hypothetical protein
VPAREAAEYEQMRWTFEIMRRMRRASIPITLSRLAGDCRMVHNFTGLEVGLPIEMAPARICSAQPSHACLANLPAAA